MLPGTGAVLGIDVGCSPTRRSTAICRLDWDEQAIIWRIERCRAVEPERTAAIARLADRPLCAAAIDGPLAPGFGLVDAYRLAERMLTLGFVRRIGKPGQSNTPVGRLLNEHANACAHTVLATGRLAPATHADAIDARAIAEAFPSAWLGLLIEQPEALGARRGTRSDLFYTHLAATGGLAAVLAHLLPGRTCPAFVDASNHDDRAALICALTALGLAAGDHRAVGDAQGSIILPPPALVRPWALAVLDDNARRCGVRLDLEGAED